MSQRFASAEYAKRDTDRRRSRKVSIDVEDLARVGLQLRKQMLELGIRFLVLIMMPAMLITHVEVSLLEASLQAAERRLACHLRHVAAANHAALLQNVADERDHAEPRHHIRKRHDLPIAHFSRHG